MEEVREAVDRAESYEAAREVFEPGPEDSPEAIPYYAAAAGLRAAWGREFCDRFNGAFHSCFCAAGAGGYEAAVRTLRSKLDVQIPPEPNSWGFYEAEPAKVTARDIFNREFKRAFPGGRLNSKRAKALWIEKQAQAQEMADTRNRTGLELWEGRRDAHNRKTAARRREWMDKVHGAALFVDAARDILG